MKVGDPGTVTEIPRPHPDDRVEEVKFTRRAPQGVSEDGRVQNLSTRASEKSTTHKRNMEWTPPEPGLSAAQSVDLGIDAVLQQRAAGRSPGVHQGAAPLPTYPSPEPAIAPGRPVPQAARAAPQPAPIGAVPAESPFARNSQARLTEQRGDGAYVVEIEKKPTFADMSKPVGRKRGGAGGRRGFMIKIGEETYTVPMAPVVGSLHANPIPPIARVLWFMAFLIRYAEMGRPVGLTQRDGTVVIHPEFLALIRSNNFVITDGSDVRDPKTDKPVGKEIINHSGYSQGA